MGIGFKMLFMGKSFRSDDLNQALLLPPSLHDWLPEKHLARFFVDVVEPLDLGAIYASYDAKDGRGQADRKSTRLNSSYRCISHAVFCLKKKKGIRVFVFYPCVFFRPALCRAVAGG